MWVRCCFSYHILFRKFTRPRRKYSNCQRSLNPTPVCVVTAPPQFCFSLPALFLRSVSTRYYTMSNYFYCDRQWKTCVCSFDTHKKNKKKTVESFAIVEHIKSPGGAVTQRLVLFPHSEGALWFKNLCQLCIVKLPFPQSDSRRVNWIKLCDNVIW